MTSQPPDVHQVPDIAELGPQAAAVLENIEILADAEEYMIQRAAQHPVLTVALATLNLTHSTVSPMRWQAQLGLRREKRLFVREYNAMYSNFPIKRREVTEVARIIFDLVEVNAHDFMDEA